MFLSKIEELRFAANNSNAVIISIYVSKRDVWVLEQEISIDNYKDAFETDMEDV